MSSDVEVLPHVAPTNLFDAEIYFILFLQIFRTKKSSNLRHS